MEQIYTPKQDYKVLVRCITYNQAKYIEDALNGFAMQKTDFPFVCLIVDDCSTDGEIDVIKSWMNRECDMTRAMHEEIKYSNITLVPHTSNPTCTFAFYFLKRNLYKEPEKKLAMYKPWREHCEYEAICEGDDYWIARDKLHKQISYLDNNHDCGMCYSLAHIYNQTKGVFEGVGGSQCNGFEDMILGNKVPNLTSCIRNTIRLSYENEISTIGKKWKMGDYPLWLWVTARYKVHCINEVMAVYRVLPNSASHSQDIEKIKIFNKSVLDICLFFWEKYSGDEELKITILDLYHRQNYKTGRIFGNWNFCFENILKIRNKAKRDYLSIIFCWLMKSVNNIIWI